MKLSEIEGGFVPIVTYARTDDECSTGVLCDSIEEQQKAMRYWAKYNHCEIFEEYADESVSGLSKSPPSLIQLVEDMNAFDDWARYVVVCNFGILTGNLVVYDWYKHQTAFMGLNTISLYESCCVTPEFLNLNSMFIINKGIFKPF